ncbi:DUF397 domain-containing protein [Streptosporangium amethystogenes]|uniref:DUF397 domain-containing protein n=1 Tax=Streptosporangium amethystogenes TaxID=2002 RepID=UPI0037B56042
MPSRDNCVEAAELPGGGWAVRDSKDSNGPVLRFSGSEWRAFIKGVKNVTFGKTNC